MLVSGGELEECQLAQAGCTCQLALIALFGACTLWLVVVAAFVLTVAADDCLFLSSSAPGVTC